MDADKRVFAHFALVVISTPPGASESSSVTSMRSQLSVPGGRGELVVNGRQIAVTGGVQTEVPLPAGDGRLVVEAWVREGGGGGLWRFELRHPASGTPGTIAVLSGEPVQVGAGTIVFRLRGRRPERVSFAVVRRPEEPVSPDR